jgi:hypothetical protein
MILTSVKPKGSERDKKVLGYKLSSSYIRGRILHSS